MPTICQFYGLVIRLYYDDHAPPHFHAYYGRDEALIALDSLSVIAGNLPRRALALVLEWAHEKRSELLANWDRAARHEPLLPVPPLD